MIVKPHEVDEIVMLMVEEAEKEEQDKMAE
jgi:hypothetical protein